MRVGPLNPAVLAAVSRVPQVKRQVRQVANEIARGARQLAPRESGTLARSIGVDNVLDDTGQVEFRVGWTLRGFYGGLVELGTEDTAPQPHLRPAAIRVRGSRPGLR